MVYFQSLFQHPIDIWWRERALGRRTEWRKQGWALALLSEFMSKKIDLLLDELNNALSSKKWEGKLVARSKFLRFPQE